MPNREYNKQVTHERQGKSHKESTGMGGGKGATQRGVYERGKKSAWKLGNTDSPMLAVPQGKPYSTGPRSALKTGSSDLSKPSGGRSDQPQGKKKGFEL